MKKFSAASLATLPEDRRAAFFEELSKLTENAVVALPYLWDVWANPLHQMIPDGNWTTWVILGGRGAGKTRAGSEWVRSRVEGAGPLDPGVCRRIALVGETLDQVRAVMVEGDSGILASSPPDRRPKFVASKNRLEWPNGAEAMLISAVNYEALRGPQFDGAWSDELAKWRNVRDAWDMLQFTLRLGSDPRQIVTTTPRDVSVLREILEMPGTVVSHAATEANEMNLAPGFVGRLRAQYGGTWMGRQELDGELMRAREGALWTREMIETARAPAPERLDRVVVAVDPPVTSGKKADTCGIVVAGVDLTPDQPQAWVLADLSVQGVSPASWARYAAAAYEEFGADRLVAEVNQGGDMVENVIRQIAPEIAYRGVHATRGKVVRAEPVASLYEQGRVHHVDTFEALEDQMCNFTGTGKSPDRLDALVWALTDLVLNADAALKPRVRTL